MASGGCCDCGDPEAWATCGNCSNHNGNISLEDPSKVLPPKLILGINAVMKGVLGVITSFTVNLARAYDCSKENEFVKHFHQHEMLKNGDEHEVDAHLYDEQGRTPQEKLHDLILSTNETYCVSLHNDDIHTYVDVATYFRVYAGMNSEVAEACTKRVDQEGYMNAHEIVFRGADYSGIEVIDDLHSKAQVMQNPTGEFRQGLLVSIAPKRWFDLEHRVTAALHWMHELGKQNDGIRRVITANLLMPVKDLPDSAEALLNCVGLCKPNEIFKNTQIYPSVIPELLKMPEGIDFDAPDSQFIHSPFARNCERNVLGVLMMTTPYLMKSVKHAVSGLVVIYQQDVRFKATFSQMLTILYPAIYGLYGRYIGTKQDEIFSTTVQVYTANRVVTMMSSDGLDMRPLTEPADNYVQIVRMLAQTLYYTLLDMKCLPNRLNDNFLLHHSLRSHRHQQLFRDFEYVTENVVGNLNLLRGTRDIGAISIWIKICLLFQNMYVMARLTDAHVENENQYFWHTSINLALEFESASTNIISNSLFPSAELLAAESQALSGKLSPSDDEPDANQAQMRSRSGSLVDFNIRKLQQLALEKVVSDVLREGLRVWGASERVNFGTRASLFPLSDRGHYTLLGQELEFPGDYHFLSFDVASSPVSVYNPIHRLLAKIFLYASYGNLNLKPVLQQISLESTHSRVILVDFPLRTLVFNVQVGAKMWRRNGISPESIVFHYNRGPINKVLKFMDVHCVQLGMLSLGELGADVVIALAVDRSRSKHLLDQNIVSSLPPDIQHFLNMRRKPTLEYEGPLLGGLLKILIDIIVCVPTCLLDRSDPNHPGGAYTDSVEKALCREIVNLVLCGASTPGQLSIASSMVGGDKTVSESILNDVIDRMCNRKVSDTGEKVTLELKPEAYAFYDPEFGHLFQEQLNESSDRVRTWRKQQARQGSGTEEATMHTPLFQQDALPAAHPHLEPIRAMLFRPLMYKLLTRSIELAISRTPLLGIASRIVSERIVYILTLQVHFRQRYRQEGSSSFAHATLNVTDHEYFLKACADLWLSDVFNADDMFKNGLAYALEAMVRAEDLSVKEYFETRQIMFASAITNSTDSSTEKASLCLVSFALAKELTEKARMLKLRGAAQKKAMESMQKATASFMMMMEDCSDDDDSDEEKAATSTADILPGSHDTTVNENAAGNGSSTKKQAKDSGPICIICRKSSEEYAHASGATGEDLSMGYLCFMQPSNNIKHAISSKNSPEDIVKNVFRVVSPAGCFVYARVITASPLEPVNASYVSGRLAQGEHVLVSRRVGRWAYIVSPMHGWVEIYTERMRFPGELPGATGVTFDHASGETHKDIILIRNLYPIREFLFARHGTSRLHASACGHSMHFNCWNEYFAMSVSRELSQIISNHDFPLAFDVMEREFTCPLCKSICNAFLPLTVPSKASLYWSSLAATEQSVESQKPFTALENWMSFISQGKASYPVRLSINNLLDTPDVPRWGNGIESVRFLDCVAYLYALPWRNKLQKSVVKLPDTDAQKELELTRSCHMLWSSIAYTLQAQYCASQWADGTSTPASAVSSDTVSLMAQLLHMLRQMPNWFEGPESFAECIGTPLKHLVSGCRADIEDDDSVSDAPYSVERASVRSVEEISVAECRESLFSTPFETIGTGNFPNPRRLSLVQRLLHHKGVQSCDLWGTLSIPILAQDLCGISVVSIACASDVQSAETLLGILSIARLCQILIEPCCTGLQAANFAASAALLTAEETLTSEKKSISSRTKASMGQGKLHYDIPANDSEAVCASLRQLQTVVVTAAGLDAIIRRPLSSQVPPLRELVLDEWVPFLEFIVCLLHTLRCAATGTAEPIPNLKELSLESLMSRAGLPVSLLTLLEGPVLAILASRWGDQLQYVQPKRFRGAVLDSWIPRVVNSNAFDVSLIPQSNEQVQSGVVQRSADIAAGTCSYGNTSSFISEVMAQISEMHHSEKGHSAISAGMQDEHGEIFKKAKHDHKAILDFLPGILGTTTEQISLEFKKSLRLAASLAASDMGPSSSDASGRQEEIASRQTKYIESTAFARQLSQKIVFGVKENAAKSIGRPLVEDFSDAEAIAAAEGRTPARDGPGALALLGDKGVSDIDMMGYSSIPTSMVAQSVLMDSPRAEPLKTWRLVGIDPTYRLIDGGFSRLELPELTVDISVIHTQSPFVGSVHGGARSYDPAGQSLCTAFCDLSHMPLRRGQRGGLIRLPAIYTDLIDNLELPYTPKLNEQGKREDEPALCLVCGTILNAGNRAKDASQLMDQRYSESPGECTLHTRTCGAGTGLYLFVLHNVVLMMRGARSSKFGALYLDKNGDTGDERGVHRPLALSITRFQKLEELYMRHQIASEVTRHRLTQDRTIRSYYY